MSGHTVQDVFLLVRGTINDRLVCVVYTQIMRGSVPVELHEREEVKVVEVGVDRVHELWVGGEARCARYLISSELGTERSTRERLVGPKSLNLVQEVYPCSRWRRRRLSRVVVCCMGKSNSTASSPKKVCARRIEGFWRGYIRCP